MSKVHCINAGCIGVLTQTADGGIYCNNCNQEYHTMDVNMQSIIAVRTLNQTLKAEVERLKKAFKHDFEPTEFGGDTCIHCGFDIRNIGLHRTMEDIKGGSDE